MIDQTIQTPRGLSRQALRTFGIIFLLAGIAGQCIIQNKMLQVGIVANEELLKLLENSQTMILATVGLILQFMVPCAIPIFTFLLVDGFKKTSNRKVYLARILGVALLSELPFDLAMNGHWTMTSQNPVFGLVLSMVMLYLFQYTTGKKVLDVLIRILVAVMAVVWVRSILMISDGAACVVITATLWALRKHRSWQIFGGCAAMVLCTVFSLFYLLAPITFIVLYFYNDEPGEGNKLVNYLAYPVLLLVVWLVARFAL